MLTTKSNINSTNSKNSLKIDSEDNCQTHSRKIECFCKRCQVPICPDCLMFGNHKTHEVCSLEEGKSKMVENFTNLTKLGILNSKMLRNDKIAIEHTVFMCEEKKNDLKNEVENVFGKIRDNLDLREIEVKSTIDGFFEEIGNRLEDKKNDCVFNLGKIEEICRIFEEKENERDLISFLKFSSKFYQFSEDLKCSNKIEDISVPDELEKIFHFKRDKYNWDVSLDEILFSIKNFINIAKFKNYEIKS